jgi:hypothetical protein
MELNLENVYYLYSACSNPTNGVLLIVLSMIKGKDALYWEFSFNIGLLYEVLPFFHLF